MVPLSRLVIYTDMYTMAAGTARAAATNARLTTVASTIGPKLLSALLISVSLIDSE